MVITHHGGEFFKVALGDMTLAFNPISKESKLKQTRFGADIALITLEHPDMNGADQVSHGERAPFVIRTPGEYEIRDVIIKGYPTVSTYGGEERINTAYLVTFEKTVLLFLGAIHNRDIPKDLKEALEHVDILFIPIGGDGVLDAKEAHQFAVSIEPNIVIPMHHTDIGVKGALQAFLKEQGDGSGIKPIDKLTFRPKELEEKQNEIVILSA
jgi:hypothetical protein